MRKPFTPRDIKDTDTISGSFFRKFVESYKAYDKSQKNLITKLYGEINSLSKELQEKTQRLEIAKELMSEDWKSSEAYRKYEGLKKSYTANCKHLYEARQEILTLKQQLACIQENQLD